MSVFAYLMFAALPKVSFEGTLANVLRLVAVIVGLLSVLFVTIGGLGYVTSAGDPQGMQKAKNTILYAIVGLVVALSVQMLVSFVLGRL